MVQQIASNGAVNSALTQTRTSSAASIAALARQSGAGRVVVFESGGVTAANDPILAITGAGLAGEASALASALANGRYGASLLQAASTGLDTIADKLASISKLEFRRWRSFGRWRTKGCTRVSSEASSTTD